MKQGLVGLVAGSMALAAAVGPARAQTTREVSRSAPIVATVDDVETQFQGSFEVVTPAPPVTTLVDAASAATFEFPYTIGHLRAVATADIAALATKFEALTPIFDAAANIPPVVEAGCSLPFGDTCRSVFTTIEAPDATGLAERPDRIFFNTTNLAQLKPLLAPALDDADVTTLISRVLAGRPNGTGGYDAALGGIDRSTLAVVDHTPFVPQIAGEDRPTMVYVGGLDGMLHAICAEVQGPCTTAGQELWAFIPRTQLGALRFNTQRIDGSVKVADVFDDFDLADTAVIREFRTVLTLQTGSGDPGTPGREPSVLAIDVSNPADPIVLWERSTPASPAAVDLGVGLGLAMGPIRLLGETRNVTIVQTNNGGSSSASGFHVAAIDTSTGQDVWTFRHTHPAPRNGANPAVPDSGIPGGAAALDIDRSGFITHVVLGSLYGDVWVLDAAGNPLDGEPLFRFSTDFHPIGATPTIYADLSTGRFYAIAVSGGYADPVAATWVQDADDQFAVSVAIESSPANTPMNEDPSSDFGGDRPFSINLGPGKRFTAQAIVSRDELFIVADKTDVNLQSYGETPDTGSLQRFSLDGTAKGSLLTIAGGGSGPAVTSAGMVHVGSGGGAMKVDVTTTGGGGAFDGTGVVIERDLKENTPRLLWLND